MNRNDAVNGVASDVNRAEVVSSTASGLKESSDELTRGRERTQVRPREELEKNVITEDIS